MGTIEYPTTRDALAGVHYSEKQSLAADLGYGTIVGVSSDDLEEFIASKLFDDAGALREEYVDGDLSTENSEESTSVDEPPVDDDRDDDVEQRTDGGSSTDSLSIGHEGKEKLSPEGAPDDDNAAVEPPEGVDLDGYSMNDLEPDQNSDPVDVDDDSDNSTQEHENANSPDDSKSGSLLSRIKGDNKRSSDDIVEDADTEEERQRRENLKHQFDKAMNSESSTNGEDVAAADRTGDVAGAGKTHTPNGIVVDEALVGHLIDMPFNTAAAATGWDGWELSSSERAANAELFVAMCDEQDIDLSPTVMFALSIGGTASGKALRYKRHKSKTDDVVDADPVEEPSDDVDEQRADGGHGDRAGGRPQVRPPVKSGERQTGESGGFDFENSEDW